MSAIFPRKRFSIDPYSFQHRNLCLEPNRPKKWDFAGEISNSAVINVIHVVSELLQDEEYIL